MCGLEVPGVHELRNCARYVLYLLKLVCNQVTAHIFRLHHQKFSSRKPPGAACTTATRAAAPQNTLTCYHVVAQVKASYAGRVSKPAFSDLVVFLCCKCATVRVYLHQHANMYGSLPTHADCQHSQYQETAAAHWAAAKG